METIKAPELSTDPGAVKAPGLGRETGALKSPFLSGGSGVSWFLALSMHRDIGAQPSPGLNMRQQERKSPISD